MFRFARGKALTAHAEFRSFCGLDLEGDRLTSRMSKSTSAAAQRPVRSDAQRNIETLLRTALAVFDSSGVDAPVREIAEKAGVGIGTIYRHFPRRADLIVAALRSEVDACADAGAELAAKHGGGEALVEWVERYVEFVTTRRGLAGALTSGDPAFEGLPPYFLQRLRPVVQSLLDAATAAGEIRGGVKPDELLCAVGALCSPLDCPDPPEARRLVGLFLDGLRFGAKR
jgi:AcrR family transcriptional regulator